MRLGTEGGSLSSPQFGTAACRSGREVASPPTHEAIGRQAIQSAPPIRSSDQQGLMGRGGSAAGGEGSALELLSSARFAPFRDDAFDPASFASRSLSESHTTAQAQQEQLQQGVAALDGALRQLVLNHQDDLIAQTARLTDAESAVQVRRRRSVGRRLLLVSFVLPLSAHPAPTTARHAAPRLLIHSAPSGPQRIALSVRSLQMVAARVRAEVAEPLQQIATRTQQLRNLQARASLPDNAC